MNIRRRVRLPAGRSGQALVEFALIAPILLMLLLGLIDFSRAWAAHHAIADAAREGTRMLVVHDPALTGSHAEAVIVDRLKTNRLNPAYATITCNGAACSTVVDQPAKGTPMNVTIGYEFDFWLLGPIMKWTTGERRVNLVSNITMRSE